MDKKVLRKELLQKRKSIDKSLKEKWDMDISKTICSLDCFRNAKQVLVFSSTEDEFDTSYIVSRCREDKKLVFYPVCLDKNGNMQFFRVDGVDDLQLGAFNILEPKSICAPYSPTAFDIVIVPNLSVDKNKNRIGYGKGYYDRFLKNFMGSSICPCYETMMADAIPVDEFDEKTQIIVTNKEVIL
jgi:5-formyltetrahydrofolate cyclo-ligase